MSCAWIIFCCYTEMMCGTALYACVWYSKQTSIESAWRRETIYRCGWPPISTSISALADFLRLSLTNRKANKLPPMNQCRKVQNCENEQRSFQTHPESSRNPQKRKIHQASDPCKERRIWWPGEGPSDSFLKTNKHKLVTNSFRFVRLRNQHQK